MPYLIENRLKTLLSAAHDIWLPNWFQAFSDPNGGFYERLDLNGQPLQMPRRLLSQCRQIIVYSSADKPIYHNKLKSSFCFMRDHYFIPRTGGSIFSLKSKLEIHDHSYDLYAHAFVILACATYYKATKNNEALTYAKTTLNFIKEHFKLDIGYAERLDNELNPISTIRRQNPHMHLLEACLFMFEATVDNDYMDIANYLIKLFYDRFFHDVTGTLGEFFDDGLNQHTQDGHKIEAGHHGEWILLLHKYQMASDNKSSDIQNTKSRLFDFIINHGIDTDDGGIFNVQDRNGDIIDDHKRIWTAFEVLRAANIMRQEQTYKQEAERMMDQILNTIEQHYIDINTGWWHEILDRNMNSIADYYPATTPYHIYPILREISTEYLNRASGR